MAAVPETAGLAISTVITADCEADLGWIRVSRGVLSAAMLGALDHHILSVQGQRTVTHHWTSERVVRGMYGAIANGMDCLADDEHNTAITKRYMPGALSGAFLEHRDPERFTARPDGRPTVSRLLTVGGWAVFFARQHHDDLLTAVVCTSNTLVELVGDPLHRVTPPMTEQMALRYRQGRRLPAVANRFAPPRTLLFIGQEAKSLTQSP